MEIRQTIKLDFRNSALPVTVFAKQGDSESRYIEVEPLNNGQPYEIPSGVTARLHLTKPDGHQIINDSEITQSGHIVAELTEQALAAEGLATAEIGLYQGTALLSSQLFFVKVVHSAYSGELVVSSDEYQALVNALATAERSVGIAEGAASTAATAAQGANSAAAAATSAASSANTAASSANTAATEAGKVNAELVLEDERAVFTVTNRQGVTKSINVSAIWARTETFEDMQNAVRLGLHTKLFPVGYEFIAHHSVMGDAVFAVRGHDHHTPADSHLTHSMTVQLKRLFGSTSAYKAVVYDAPEALFYASEAIPAGTYHFTWSYATGSMASGTYQFTLTQPVPAGGQIVLGTNSSSTAITSCRISTYASIGATTAIESGIVITAGDGGTDLGTTGATTSSGENMNCAQRIMWGSNNAAQSALRQWMNSTAALGSVWAPQTKFDRAPSWHTGSDAAYAGFMGGFDNDFLKIVQTAVIPCRTNSVFETPSLDGTTFTVNQTFNIEDKFFLLSRPEMYGSWDSTSIKDGELLDFYDGLTDLERIQYDVFGSPHSAWLRSPNPSYAYGVRNVLASTGALNLGNARYADGAAPACIIA